MRGVTKFRLEGKFESMIDYRYILVDLDSYSDVQDTIVEWKKDGHFLSAELMDAYDLEHTIIETFYCNPVPEHVCILTEALDPDMFCCN